MTEIDRILDQLERSRRGEAWHGPSLEEALANIDAATAAARPISNAHTIWELALHMASWQDVVRRRLAGEEVVPTPTLDWPEADEASEAAWASAPRGAPHESPAPGAGRRGPVAGVAP